MSILPKTIHRFWITICVLTRLQVTFKHINVWEALMLHALSNEHCGCFLVSIFQAMITNQKLKSMPLIIKDLFSYKIPLSMKINPAIILGNSTGHVDDSRNTLHFQNLDFLNSKYFLQCTLAPHSIGLTLDMGSINRSYKFFTRIRNLSSLSHPARSCRRILPKML